MTSPSDQDDIDLFRKEVGDIEHLTHDKVTPVANPINVTPTSQRRSAHGEESSLADIYEPNDLVGSEETLIFRRSGIQERQLTKLKGGQIKMDAELDLHGMTIPVAHQALVDFIADCLSYNIRGARLIHGKGWSSKHHKPILKTKLTHWLRDMDEVLAFCSARIEDGGTGALYLLLRKQVKK
jgi:DNA-nicking Smr family endonuclease